MSELDQDYHCLPGDIQKAFDIARQKLCDRKVVSRIWSRDYTVWRPDPTKITDRLGWLEVARETLQDLPELKSRIDRLHGNRLTDVVLLGMGGSSLCPEVFKIIFGQLPNHPCLHVLDSTSPDWVRSVTEIINLPSTLFIAASKSGGTIEVMSGYKHFWNLVSQERKDPGQQFIAITDPETSLVELAAESGFADTFINSPEIGGRYSALSLFGIVPALLIGVDVEEILRRACRMVDACRREDVLANPGARLGLFMTACAAVGRDKLTLVLDPKLESLGLWIEQLIAESTGKEDKGILPIAMEPVESVSFYGFDRAFVSIHEKGNDTFEEALGLLSNAGHPVMKLEMDDLLDLGAEFYRWEFATGVVSHFLEIQPFDQPDVQEAKRLTGEVIAEYKQTGMLPHPEDSWSLDSLLETAAPGQFIALLAYTRETPEADAALKELRRVFMRRFCLATTCGYGPRYLHSTGQYHKGGPNTGLFIQLVQDQEELPIPGEPYGFSVLFRSQALGDYQALISRGRKVARVSLGSDTVEEINKLVEKVQNLQQDGNLVSGIDLQQIPVNGSRLSLFRVSSE